MCPLPILGTLTDEVRQLDMKYFESEERIRKVAKSFVLREKQEGRRVACVLINSHQKCQPLTSLWEIELMCVGHMLFVTMKRKVN
jgi:hypothetical protein